MQAPAKTRFHTRRIIALAGLLAALLVVAPHPLTVRAAAAAAANASVSASSVVKGSVTKQSDLNFGALVAGATGGSVTVSAAGVRVATGSVSLIGGTVSNAEFKLTCQQNKAFTVLPIAPITVSNGAGGTMSVSLAEVTLNPTNSKCANAGLPGNLGEARVFVGGTMLVGPSQAAGTYTGTFTVTVNF